MRLIFILYYQNHLQSLNNRRSKNPILSLLGIVTITILLYLKRSSYTSTYCFTVLRSSTPSIVVCSILFAVTSTIMAGAVVGGGS